MFYVQRHAEDMYTERPVKMLILNEEFLYPMLLNQASTQITRSASGLEANLYHSI